MIGLKLAHPRSKPAPPKGNRQPRPPLRGMRLAAARLVWLLGVALSLGVFVATTGARYVQLLSEASRNGAALARLNLTYEFLARYLVVLDYLTVFAFALIGLVIFWRKSDDRVGIFVSLALIVLATTVVRPGDATRFVPLWLRLPVLVTYPLATSLVIVFLFIFPDGRPVPRWSPWLTSATTISLFAWFLLPTVRDPVASWPPPPMPLFYFGAITVAVACQIYRYARVSDARQQEQTKWVVYGFMVALVCLLGFELAAPALNPRFLLPGMHRVLYIVLGVPLLYASLILLPLTIGISILRRRLYDIDVIINRTLVYVSLTAILAGLYSASITLFQKVFTQLTGNKSDAAIVMTTLILASAFTPIKNALQGRADRRFKEAHDPTRKLAAFCDQLNDILDVFEVNRLTSRLLEEAVAAFGAESGAIWLRQDGKLQLAHRHGKWTGEARLSVPLGSAGEPLGRLSLGQRCDGLDYKPEDHEILHQLASVTAQALALTRRVDHL